MDAFRSPTDACERARAFASLELDGELSELERVRLAEHLRTCDACAVAVAAMRAFTAAVRSAPLEEPRRQLLRPAPEPERSARPRPYVRLALAAAAAVLVSGLGVVVASFRRDDALPAPPRHGDIALLRPADDLQRIRAHRARENEAPRGRVFSVDREAGV
jgi:anti-sigma factor RsiW